MTQDEKKKQVAQHAVDLLEKKLSKVKDAIIGVGTGSTVDKFIEELAKSSKLKEFRTVSSSIASTNLLKENGIKVIELDDALNERGKLDIYVDGADEATDDRHLIKGGGGALTREKIVTSASKEFICIIDDSKRVKYLGETFKLPVEVIPMAQTLVKKELERIFEDAEVELRKEKPKDDTDDSKEEERAPFKTDNGCYILDVDLKAIDAKKGINNPKETEQKLNNIAGVVTVGIFALDTAADMLLIGTKNGFSKL